MDADSDVSSEATRLVEVFLPFAERTSLMVRILGEHHLIRPFLQAHPNI